MYMPLEYKTKYQQEGIAKIKSMLFQAKAIFRLYVEKIWKKTPTILSGTTLNESNFFAEGWFACSLTCEKYFFSKKKCVQEYFKNIVLSLKAIIMQLHLGSAQK